MQDVFISYSSKDKAVADAVCARLEAQGVRCWIAPRDVVPSEPYGEAIIRAIHGSRVMVLIFSANSNESPQVMREVERAVSQGLAILPFRIENVPLSPNMEYFISAPHWLDAMTHPLDDHLERLAATVKVILAQTGAKSEATAPQTPPPEVVAPPIPHAPSAPYAAPPPTKKNSLPVMLVGGALLLLIVGGIWGLSRGRSIGVSEQNTSERTSAALPVAEPTSAPAAVETSEAPTANTADVTPETPSDSLPGESSHGQKLSGRVGEELTDGRWRFQLLDVQPVKSYTMQKTTQADYAAFHATSDFVDNTFHPQNGYELFVLHGRIVNASKEKQTFWHYNTNTAILDGQDESYSPLAFDMRGGQIQSDPLLPESKLDFVMIFALSKGRQPKELVFTLRSISEKPTTDVHVQLK